MKVVQFVLQQRQTEDVGEVDDGLVRGGAVGRVGVVDLNYRMSALSMYLIQGVDTDFH